MFYVFKTLDALYVTICVETSMRISNLILHSKRV